jgi:uncharacterized phage protein (TIGR02220 family)
MKLSAEGFRQKKLIDYGLDVIDAYILRYFIDFKDSGHMFSKLIDGKQYYWVKYEAVMEALPILNLNKADSVYRRLKKMVQAGILESVTVKQGGVYSYYRTGANYIYLIDDSKEVSEISSDINPSISDRNLRETDNNPTVTDEYPRETDVNPKETDIYPEQNINLLYSSINNKSINNIYSAAEAVPVDEVVDYLNERAGTEFKSTNRKTRDLIKARCKEGFVLDAFKKVIDNKCAEWKGTEFEVYIRPETLFGTKFESYLNQKVSKGSRANPGCKYSTFNNFEQREYDFDALEKRLLGYE